MAHQGKQHLPNPICHGGGECPDRILLLRGKIVFRGGGVIFFHYCQTLGLVLRLRVDFVLPLSQQQEEEEQEQEEQE